MQKIILLRLTNIAFNLNFFPHDGLTRNYLFKSYNVKGCFAAFIRGPKRKSMIVYLVCILVPSTIYSLPHFFEHKVITVIVVVVVIVTVVMLVAIVAVVCNTAVGDSGIQLKYCYCGGDRDASGVSYADADGVSCIITKLAMNFHTYMNACYSDNTVVFQRL